MQLNLPMQISDARTDCICLRAFLCDEPVYASLKCIDILPKTNKIPVSVLENNIF